MSNARNIFNERLSAFRAATQEQVIVSRAPTEVAHNNKARLFRSGLAVVSYAMIEDFLKARLGEVLQRIGSTGTAFGDLPEQIRTAATSGVISALKFQERYLDRRSTDYFRFFQNHAQAIASTSGAAYGISPLAFLNDQSNVSAADIFTILTAFHVDNPWSALGGVASKAGVGVLDLKAVFERAALRRHRAAHQANADIETSDLIAFGNEIVGLALAFDLLLSKSLRKILDADREYLSGRKKVTGRQIEMRILQYDGQKWWREVIPGARRASARNEDLNTLIIDCSRRARAAGQAVVIVGDNGIPDQWRTPEID